jgi:CDP-diacylglycerol---serine O-phosphatidyltransferase
MKISTHVPNFITLLNLLCGVTAIICIFQFELYMASWLIIAGALFDFMDGLVARLLKVSSELGKQLDSLSDVVTFGVAPGLMGYKILEQQGIYEWYVFLPLLIPVFGALRLAKFNIDTRQTDSFVGLPIPANALFWLSLPLMVHYNHLQNIEFIDVSHAYAIYTILPASVLLSLMMVMEVPMMALKFKRFGWVDNQWRYIFILLSGILLIFFLFAAIPIILLLYTLISLIQNAGKK